MIVVEEVGNIKKLTYIQGAFILAASNLVTGVLSFGFRIFFSYHVGPEGMGLYQLVLPLYMLMITLVSGGLTTALSTLISEQKTKGNYSAINKTIKISFMAIGLWSFLICLLMELNTHYIADHLLKDSRTTLSIMVFVPSVFFVSLSAIFKGYFYGMQEIKPPALIDVIEKIIRLGGLIAVTKFMLPYGVEAVCAGAMLAMTIGEFVSLLLMGIVYFFRKQHFQRKEIPESAIHIIGTIIRLAIPLSVGGALSTIMDMICAVLIPARLKMTGLDTSSALSLYGELTGMVLPLIFFPAVIIFSLSITLVPALTQSFVNGNHIALNKKCNDSLMIAWSIGLLATVLSVSFPHELCRLFFKCPQAGDLLFWMGWGCSFEYLKITQFAVLNGLGLRVKALYGIFWNILITVSCIVFLIPHIGIYGYICGFLASAVVVSLRNAIILRKQTYIKIHYVNILLKPLLPFFGMYIIVRICNMYLRSIGFTYNMISSGLLGIIFFMLLLIIGGIVTLNQIKSTMNLRK